MFQRRADDSFYSKMLYRRFDDHIVGFCSTGSENDFSRSYMKIVCNLSSYIFNKDFASCPKLCVEDGFPKFIFIVSTIASITSSASGVVAALSKYILSIIILNILILRR
jgi:hypothetical protein